MVVDIVKLRYDDQSALDEKIGLRPQICEVERFSQYLLACRKKYVCVVSITRGVSTSQWVRLLYVVLN